MRVFGECCLFLCLVATGYAAFLSLWGTADRRRGQSRLGIWATLVSFGSLSASLAVLTYALASGDFSFHYVSAYSSRLLAWQYRISAIWVGQAGSLLLWTWMMGACALLVHFLKAGDPVLRRTAFGIVMGSVFFLLVVMVFAADPMEANLTTPREGTGLSPLLQHPNMLIHPPVVFFAYAVWSVPCALALAALFHGRLGTMWIQMARPWAMAGWIMLGVGLLLGAHWAYQELGWGGYWGWDPVENASLLPWMTGTALIHSMLAWRKSECLKKTSLLLAIVTFSLCNFATFLTRSGIFSSVHAFSESPIGWMFLALMAGLLGVAVVLIAQRRSSLTSRTALCHILARETLILVSVYLLMLFTLVVLGGTLVGPLSMMVTGRTVQIGPEFYESVLPPVGLTILGTMAAVPLLRWGGPPRPTQRRLLTACVIASGLLVAFAVANGMHNPLALAMLALAALTVSAISAAYIQEAWQRQFGNLGHTAFAVLMRGRRRYAAYFIHLGLACVAVGVTGSSIGAQRTEVTMDEGDTLNWAGRQVHYVRLEQSELPDKLIAEAVLEVAHGDSSPVELRPARHLHLLQNEWTSEVAIQSTWRGDLYTVLHAGLGDGRVVLSLVDNPLVNWIWVGGIVATIGGAAAMWPMKHRQTVRTSSPRTGAQAQERRSANEYETRTSAA